MPLQLIGLESPMQLYLQLGLSFRYSATMQWVQWPVGLLSASELMRLQPGGLCVCMTS